MNRREFMKTTASVAASSVMSPALKSYAKTNRRIGIQTGAVSYVDEGERQVLDNVQELAGVNTIFIPVFAYNRGLAGRAYLSGDEQFFAKTPDHGNVNFSSDYFHGGYYATPHMKYYKNTIFKEHRAPEFGDYDVLAAVLPEAKKRGLTTVAMMADNFKSYVPNSKTLMQVDMNGNRRDTVCFNSPDFQGFLMGLIEDCVRSYDIDALLWRSEKTGPLMEVLGLSHSSGSSGNAGCFCQFCKARAQEMGINAKRALTGYEELRTFIQNSVQGTRPVDGFYVTFWRILLRYPEIFQWQRLFQESLKDTYRSINNKVKSIKPNVPTGWGFSSQQIYSHMFRADADLKSLAGFTDFMKFYIYYNVGGPRSGKYVEKLGKTVMGDVPRDQLLQFVYRLMGYGDEGTFDDLVSQGYSADYVLRETKRALNGAEGTGIKIWPAIDVDLPSRRYWSDFDDYALTRPESLKKAVKAVFRAGSDRILLARKYSEMHLTNLKAVGDALKEI